MDEIILDSIDLIPESGPGFDVSALLTGSVILFGIVFLVISAVLLKKIFSRPELHGLTREKVKNTWEEIEQLSSQGIQRPQNTWSCPNGLEPGRGSC